MLILYQKFIINYHNEKQYGLTKISVAHSNRIIQCGCLQKTLAIPPLPNLHLLIFKKGLAMQIHIETIIDITQCKIIVAYRISNQKLFIVIGWWLTYRNPQRLQTMAYFSSCTIIGENPGGGFFIKNLNNEHGSL